MALPEKRRRPASKSDCTFARHKGNLGTGEFARCVGMQTYANIQWSKVGFFDSTRRRNWC